jgi:hypothetical protein
MVVFWVLTLFAGTILTLGADRRDHQEPDGAVSLALRNVGLIGGSPTPTCPGSATSA